MDPDLETLAKAELKVIDLVKWQYQVSTQPLKDVLDHYGLKPEEVKPVCLSLFYRKIVDNYDLQRGAYLEGAREEGIMLMIQSAIEKGCCIIAEFKPRTSISPLNTETQIITVECNCMGIIYKGMVKGDSNGR